MTEEKTDKLTNEDAQMAIRSNLIKMIEEHIPAEWRIKKWKELAESKEVKIFCNERLGLVESDSHPALQIQARAMENISKIAGDYPSQGLRFEGADGRPIIFEVNYGPEEGNEDD